MKKNNKKHIKILNKLKKYRNFINKSIFNILK